MPSAVKKKIGPVLYTGSMTEKQHLWIFPTKDAEIRWLVHFEDSKKWLVLKEADDRPSNKPER